MSGPQPRVGVDLGGTKTAAGLVDADGRVLMRAQERTPAAHGPAAVVDTVAGLVARVDPEGRSTTVGIGSAGVVDPVAGVVVGSTDAIRGWVGTDLRGRVSEATGRRVAVLNDVLAFLLGEVAHGAARGARDAMGVSVGTGVGGALLVGGVPVSGRNSAAGHVGHVASAAARGLRCGCGRVGHVEAVASGPAMSRAYAAATGETKDVRVTLPDVVSRVGAGDAVAVRVLEDGGRALGEVLGGLVNAVAPQVVVLGGGVVLASPEYVRAVRDSLCDTVIPALRDVEVRVAELGADAGIVGAAAGVEAPRG